MKSSLHLAMLRAAVGYLSRSVSSWNTAPYVQSCAWQPPFSHFSFRSTMAKAKLAKLANETNVRAVWNSCQRLRIASQEAGIVEAVQVFI